jgi:ammonia channel protein AmtB
MCNGAFAGVTFFVITAFEQKIKVGRMIILEPVPLLNAVIAGLVGSSGSCAYTDAIGASIIGSVSGLIYQLSVKILKRFEIDDPLESS